MGIYVREYRYTNGYENTWNCGRVAETNLLFARRASASLVESRQSASRALFDPRGIAIRDCYDPSHFRSVYYECLSAIVKKGGPVHVTENKIGSIHAWVNRLVGPSCL